MSDLIKREDAIDAVIEWYGCKPNDIEAFEKIIKAIPSADRPQGEWLKFGLGRGTRILFCTNCERKIEVPLSQGDSNYDFCPHCGARMKGADDEVR